MNGDKSAHAPGTFLRLCSTPPLPLCPRPSPQRGEGGASLDCYDSTLSEKFRHKYRLIPLFLSHALDFVLHRADFDFRRQGPQQCIVLFVGRDSAEPGAPNAANNERQREACCATQRGEFSQLVEQLVDDSIHNKERPRPEPGL